MATMNQYTDITDYYDLLVTQGYYNYQGMAEAVYSVMQGREKVLDLGVGTGLLAEELLKLAPECEFTGVDITASMLEIARERLGENVKLVEADVIKMDLQETFDMAISSGGVWIISQRGDKNNLGTHGGDIELHLQGLINLAKHIRQDGLVLLNLQADQANKETNLPDGIVYSQEVKKISEDEENELIEKSYFFKRNGEILAQQHLILGFIKEWKKEELMEKAGFAFVGADQNQKFHIYKRI
ncbi:MAG: class I SAM-dependent methyltransferase [Sphaerospermopsis sp. SIO1G2]|nr:class I SAM-dependent methyltransferase [Sphaerospermopsis sp. SIO1G1]NET69692.1 class I SAM-dependent methyltransferase [Sphaerospermopsis sp. SIO1G2]